MRKNLLLLLLASVLISQPKREARAVWLATVYGLDWPTEKATSPAGIQKQKNELIRILDSLKFANFNTVIMQVRARGDLIYPSQYEPWAASLTGTLGRDPGYDPLKFAIEETHKRGMEFHAWWNVAKVKDVSTPPATNPPHIVLRHPDYVKYYERDKEWWIDMGKPEARNYLINVVMELVRNYDIDGIHFDFIRYPNPDFPDSDTYALYASEYPNKDEWRRENINKFVRAVYDSIKNLKPWVKVGSAPIGIYKNICDSSGVYVYSQNCNSCRTGTPVATGWQAYCLVYQDSRRWLIEGKHDYLSPQIYWDIATNPRFNVLVRDWENNSYGKHIFAGIAAYKMSSDFVGDWPVSEVLAQIDTTRAVGGKGNTFFRYKSLRLKGLIDSLKSSRYGYYAFVPPMPWIDSIKPNPPVNLTLRKISDRSFELVWGLPEPSADNDSVKYYAIYKSETAPVDINDIKNLIGVVDGTRISYTDQVSDGNKVYFYVVTAFDKLHNESDPSNQVSTIPVFVAGAGEVPQKFELYQNYPNPFNLETTIEYELPFDSWVSLKIYNVLGQEVKILVEDFKKAGKHKVVWDGRDETGRVATSGIYFGRMIAGTFTKTIKMLLMK